MNTRTLLPDIFEEEDTYRILDIAGHFLVRYFGHCEEGAAALMVDFFRLIQPDYDEDTVHHVSAYRMASIIHYLQHLKQPHGKLGEWLIATGAHHQPPEAAEYFREHYFTIYRDSPL